MKTSSVISHFAASAIVTIVMLLIYVTVQQMHRTAANDPQLQLARDLSRMISSDKGFDKFLPADTFDISASLGTFVTLYDNNGTPVSSNGMLYGKLPKMPSGVYEFARANQENVLTWQPQPGVRLAMVVETVRSADYGFVSVGRSLVETERRESSLVTMLTIAWFACMGVIVIHFALQAWLAKRKTTVS